MSWMMLFLGLSLGTVLGFFLGGSVVANSAKEDLELTRRKLQTTQGLMEAYRDALQERFRKRQ